MAQIERNRDERGLLTCVVKMSLGEYAILCNFARNPIDKELSKLKKKIEKYEDKHNAGIATSRDEDKILEIKTQIEDLEYLIIEV